MRKLATLFIGLDVHKESISVAHVTEDRRAEVSYVGRIGTRPADIDRLVRRLQERADRLVVAYEAGPCGCLVARGKHPNVVVTAIARELAAFMWAIAKEVPISV